MATVTQAHRLIALDTPLGPDKLVLASFSGSEEMSRLFSYRLEMVSAEDSIAADKIVGKPVTFSVKLADGQEQRFFHGIVSRFSAGGRETGLRRYMAEVVPWLWFLTRTADCRIFQTKSVPEIIEQIFGDLGFSDFDKSQIKGTHPKWDYCVQYRESDFAFVSRLMEREGIFYYFKHEEGKHTLVLADHKGAYKDCPEKDVEYEGTETSRGRQDSINRWEHRYEFRPGKWATTDYDFEKPSTSLMNNEKTVVKLPGNDKYEVYDYPVAYVSKDDGKAMLRVRMEEEEAAYDVAQGTSTYRTFTPGHKFKFKRHDCEEEQGKGYVITSIQHSAVEPTDPAGAAAGFDYANAFICIPDSVTFRPARTTPKPFVQGPQTAVVVGPPGEEIYTDKYSRVKVQFHWDREGKKDENSSCWVRVSQAYAGQGWGAVCIPRIGQEVIVDFLEGNPDQPLVTGRVYNAEQMPPFALPANKVVSGLKSNSSPGGGGYNELSFNDTKGKEKITLHGQYDMNSTIEHDESHVVHNNRTVAVDGTFIESVKGDVTMIYGAKLTSLVTGTVVEQYNDAQTTLVKSGVLIMSTSANVHVIGTSEVMLNSGASTLLLKKDGTIELTGTNITISATSALNLSGQTVNITGQSEVLSGVGGQTVKCDAAEVAVSGAAVKSAATGNNEITGAIVKIN